MKLQKWIANRESTKAKPEKQKAKLESNLMITLINGQSLAPALTWPGFAGVRAPSRKPGRLACKARVLACLVLYPGCWCQCTAWSLWCQCAALGAASVVPGGASARGASGPGATVATGWPWCRVQSTMTPRGCRSEVC